MKIGKIAVLALLFCLVSVTAFSFDAAVGLKGGIGLAHLSGPGYQDTLDFFGIETQAKLGYGAGVFATLGLTGLVALQAEAYYAVLGGKYGDDTGSLVEDYPVFQMPLLLKLRVNAGNLIVTPLAGPVVLIKAGGLGNHQRGCRRQHLQPGSALHAGADAALQRGRIHLL
jgi:hypothetical protein